MKKSVKIIIVALIAIGLLSAYLFIQDSNRLTTEIDTNTEQTETTEQKEETTEDSNKNADEQDDSKKKAQPEDESAEPTQQNLPRPIITYAGSTSADSPSNEDYIVSAFVQSSENGICELELTKGAEGLVKTSETFHQPSYKQCDDFLFDDSELASGTWVAKVRFVKNNLKSEFSEPYEFEVN